jgi:hypothetical protein
MDRLEDMEILSFPMKRGTLATGRTKSDRLDGAD